MGCSDNRRRLFASSGFGIGLFSWLASRESLVDERAQRVGAVVGGGVLLA